MSLFNLGDFVLHSGERSRFKIDCDALTDADIEALAAMVAAMVGPFSTVVGVPRGGLRLAEALTKLASPEMRYPHLIVDDVLTTGASMGRFYMDTPVGLRKHGIIGAVLFARRSQPCPIWIKPLFQLSETLKGV